MKISTGNGESMEAYEYAAELAWRVRQRLGGLLVPVSLALMVGCAVVYALLDIAETLRKFAEVEDVS